MLAYQFGTTLKPLIARDCVRQEIAFMMKALLTVVLLASMTNPVCCMHSQNIEQAQSPNKSEAAGIVGWVSQLFGAQSQNCNSESG